MRVLLVIVLFFHGLIHLMGVAKAFGFASSLPLTQAITPAQGLFWLTATLLLVTASVLLALQLPCWLVPAGMGLVLSQYLIFGSWQDARFGTLANLIVLLAVILSLTSLRFEAAFHRDIKTFIQPVASASSECMTEKDLEVLPPLVQKYLRLCGVLHRPKVRNMRVVFEGEMRGRGKNWFPFRSEQYNAFDEPTRLFFMKGRLFGLTVPGYHRYASATATMDIRLFGLVPLVSQAGPIMDRTETVTLFNDMCLLAPASLIDPRISWEPVDDHRVRARFSHRDIVVSAELEFNTQGQLVNFVSHDRTSVDDMKSYPFSTPVTRFGTLGAYSGVIQGDAVWHYPDGAFTYGRFRLLEIQYNVGS